jgi:hypothetical protein
MYLDLIRRRSLSLSTRSPLRPIPPGHLIVGKDELPHGCKSCNDWYHQAMLSWQISFAPLLKRCRIGPRNTGNLKAVVYLQMKQLIIDLDRLDSLISYYPDTRVSDLCLEIVTLASQLLDSADEILSRGPTMHDMIRYWRKLRHLSREPLIGVSLL